MVDIAGAVVLQNGPKQRQSRHDGLAPAGEACEEMRLDEAREDAHGTAQKFLVNPDFVAAGGRARQGVRIAVTGVILHDAESAHDLFAEHRLKFVRRVGPVRPSGNQQDNGLIRDMAQFIEQHRQNRLVRRRAGDVVADNRDGIRRLDQFPQRPRADGMAQSLPHRPRLVGQSLDTPRPNDIHLPAVRQVYLQPRLTVCEPDVHTATSLSERVSETRDSPGGSVKPRRAGRPYGGPPDRGRACLAMISFASRAGCPRHKPSPRPSALTLGSPNTERCVWGAPLPPIRHRTAVAQASHTCPQTFLINDRSPSRAASRIGRMYSSTVSGVIGTGMF